MANILKGMLLLFIVGCSLIGCGHRARPEPGQGVPLDFKYPSPQLQVKYETPFVAKTLSGEVVDPSGARRKGVLIERMSPDWTTRLEAVFTDENGRFEFEAKPGVHFLRISFPGYDNLLLKVEVRSDAGSPLSIELRLSS
jgi:hypothetical protein